MGRNVNENPVGARYSMTERMRDIRNLAATLLIIQHLTTQKVI